MKDVYKNLFEIYLASFLKLFEIFTMSSNLNMFELYLNSVRIVFEMLLQTVFKLY